ncbi:MAG: hypothetical protein PWP03_725 [Candidatus Woesearchaeota archaeon]|nr:hypothetical protein [Candidatus Woesearchaeota archaeon]MDN5328087.1 hypothetical protein [Candidatus Woesearchaeota archaeon]
MKVKINGQEYEFDNGLTVLEACRKIGIKIPTFCYHELLEPRAVCRLCVVEVDGKLRTSCSTKLKEGMNIVTNSEKVFDARRTNLQLLIADHKQECLSCNKSTDCKLFEYANEYEIEEIPFEILSNENPTEKQDVDDSSYAFIRDLSKCIKCGKCVQVCSELQTVNALTYAGRGRSVRPSTAYEVPINQTECVFCGQCVINCPTCALEEKSETDEVVSILNDKDYIVAAQIAPSVRVSIGEEFGLPAGEISTGKLITALRMLGFDYVFDTQFGADLTIVEEANELIKRLEGNGKLPMFTSCCPAWVKFVEEFYPEHIENLSSCKSPQQMFGAVFKTYFAKKIGKHPEQLKLVSIMPCIAKKEEARRYEFIEDVDFVLTTRELARLLKSYGIDFAKLKEGSFDSPLGESSGAGTIFGLTGGVCQAALRTVNHLLTNQEKLEFEFSNVSEDGFLREGSVEINGRTIRFAVVQTLGKARKIFDNLDKYDFIEVMACPGGCVGGGGQPIPTNMEIVQKRIKALRKNDEMKSVRLSHLNPSINKLYEEFLEKPLSEKAHKLLHTTYLNRKNNRLSKDFGI